MPLDWSPLAAWVRSHQSILLMTHVRPDADGIGSQLALAEAFTALGKRVEVVIASKLPPRYAFLNGTPTRFGISARGCRSQSSSRASTR